MRGVGTGMFVDVPMRPLETIVWTHLRERLERLGRPPILAVDPLIFELVRDYLARARAVDVAEHPERQGGFVDETVRFWGTALVVDQNTPTNTGRTICESCGVVWGVGQSYLCKEGHGFVNGYHPFIPYFDFALGAQVGSLAQRWSMMKRQEDGEGLVVRERLEYRDKMSPGEITARKDRLRDRAREEARRR